MIAREPTGHFGPRRHRTTLRIPAGRPHAGLVIRPRTQAPSPAAAWLARTYPHLVEPALITLAAIVVLVLAVL